MCVDGTTRYEISWRSGGDVVGNVNVTTSPYTITGLVRAIEYTITVYAFKNKKILVTMELVSKLYQLEVVPAVLVYK